MRVFQVYVKFEDGRKKTIDFMVAAADKQTATAHVDECMKARADEGVVGSIVATELKTNTAYQLP